MPFLPLIALIAAAGGAFAYWNSRNQEGTRGPYKWTVRGGWSGDFEAFWSGPVLGTRTLGKFESFDRAKAAALEAIALDSPQPGAQLVVGIPSGQQLSAGIVKDE